MLDQEFYGSEEEVDNEARNQLDIIGIGELDDQDSFTMVSAVRVEEEKSFSSRAVFIDYTSLRDLLGFTTGQETEAPVTETAPPETEAQAAEEPSQETEAPAEEAVWPEIETPVTEGPAEEQEPPAAETPAEEPPQETEAPVTETAPPATEAPDRKSVV